MIYEPVSVISPLELYGWTLLVMVTMFESYLIDPVAPILAVVTVLAMVLLLRSASPLIALRFVIVPDELSVAVPPFIFTVVIAPDPSVRMLPESIVMVVAADQRRVVPTRFNRLVKVTPDPM